MPKWKLVLAKRGLRMGFAMPKRHADHSRTSSATRRRDSTILAAHLRSFARRRNEARPSHDEIATQMVGDRSGEPLRLRRYEFSCELVG